ncbi:MAG: glycosyltransferase family 39 protein [Gemmatimonadales bacterium]|nr:glycosyltransferase family 39 protein [Gemmatimonadales bacterium]
MTNPHSRRTLDDLFPWVYSVLIGGVAWLLHVYCCPVGDIGVETDFYGELVVAAQKIHSGDFSVLNYPYKGPFYSFVLAILHPVVRMLGGDWYDSGVLLNILCAGVGLVIVHRLLFRFRGRVEAITGVVLLSLVYEFFFHTHKGSSDLLFFTLYLGSISLLLGEGVRNRDLAGSALLAGFAFLTRYNGLILPVSAVVVLLSVWPAVSDLKRRLVRSLLYVSVFAVVVAPWYATNLVETGRWTSTRHLENIFVEEFYTPGQQGSSVESQPPTSMAEVFREDPAGVLGTYLTNIPGHLSRDLLGTLGWPLGVLAGLGLMVIALRIRDRRLAVFLALEALYFLAMCLVYHQPRFLFPLLPAYTLGASLVLWNWRLTGPRRVLPVVVLVLLIGWQIKIITDGERYYAERCPEWVPGTASVLQRNFPGDGSAVPTLMARKPHLAFYSGLPWAPYPSVLGSAGEFLQRVAASGAELIAVSDFELFYHEDKPWLLSLDDAAGVTLLHRDDHARIFRLDMTLSPQEMIKDPRIMDLLPQLEAARQGTDHFLSANLASEVARLFAEDHEYFPAREYLQLGLSELQDVGTQSKLAPKVAELRLNYAYICFQMGDTEAGISMLENNLADFALPDRPELMQRAEQFLARYRR